MTDKIDLDIKLDILLLCPTFCLSMVKSFVNV
jgi:hypothetical protein